MVEEEQRKAAMNKALLVFNCALIAIGGCGGPLITRLYYVHGGKRIWFASWLQAIGCPIILIPLVICYFHRRRTAARDPSGSGTTKLIFMKARMFIASAVIGLISGLDNYLYSYGVARLPVSTSALIIASQLAFTAGFAYLLVRQRFTSYSINAVVLLTIGGAVLALHTNGDRPASESNKEYTTGFLMTVAAAVVYGFLLPLIELAYKKGRQAITVTLILEMQMVVCVFATIFSTVGMLINNDFEVIPREAREFGLGVGKYYAVVVCSAIIWQSIFLGIIGVIFCYSSLFSGILIAALLPITEVLAVIIFHDKFQVEKGISLTLSLWGFVSYFYGENIKHKKNKNQHSPVEAEV